MAIRLACSKCGKVHMLRDKLAGRVILCSHCGAALRAPATGIGEPGSPPRPQPDWMTRFAGVVGGGIGIALGWLVLYLADLSGFWTGMIATVLGVAAGVILGQRFSRMASSRPRKGK
jgi:hypothetical protein